MRRVSYQAIVFAALFSVFASQGQDARADVRAAVPMNWTELDRGAAHVFAAPDDQSVVIVQHYQSSDQQALAAQILSALRVSDEADREDMVLRQGDIYHRSCIGERGGEPAVIQVSVVPHLSGGFVTVTGIIDPAHVMRDVTTVRRVTREVTRLSRSGYDLNLPGLIGLAEPEYVIQDTPAPEPADSDTSAAELTLAAITPSEGAPDPAPEPSLETRSPEPVPAPEPAIIPEPERTLEFPVIPEPVPAFEPVTDPEPAPAPQDDLPVSGFVNTFPAEAAADAAVTDASPLTAPEEPPVPVPAPVTPANLDGLHIGSGGLQDIIFYADGSFTEIGYVATFTAISGLDGKQGGSGLYAASPTSITLTYADGTLKSGGREGGVITIGGGALEKLGG